MSIWLILSPVFAWLTFGLFGAYLLRSPASVLWRNVQFTTVKRPFDPADWRCRLFAIQSRVIGTGAVLAACFITLMSLLVAVGFVSPAHN